MAILFVESFDGFASDFQHKALTTCWTDNGATLGLSSGRYGGGALIDGGITEGNYYEITPASTNHIRISWLMKMNNSAPSTTGNRPVVGLRNKANNRWWRAIVGASGVLSISKFDDLEAATNSFNSAASVNDNAWHHYEVEIIAHTSTGTIRLWIDGVLEAGSVVSGDTSDAASGDVTAFDLVTLCGGSANSGTVDVLIDDVLIWDDVGTDFTGHLPEVTKMVLAEATGNGADGVDWIPGAGSNYQNIDEAAIDETTTFNSSSTPGDIDYYNCNNIVISPVNIHAVILETVVRNADIGTRTYRPKAKSGSTVENGTTTTLPPDYQFRHLFMGKNPDGDITWTKAAVQALQFGGEVVA